MGTIGGLCPAPASGIAALNWRVKARLDEALSVLEAAVHESGDDPTTLQSTT